jgi:hypothetical protein
MRLSQVPLPGYAFGRQVKLSDMDEPAAVELLARAVHRHLLAVISDGGRHLAVFSWPGNLGFAARYLPMRLTRIAIS